MAMTYTSLVETIGIWINRNDATTLAQIPQFISNAEQKICNEDENLGLIQVVQGTFIAASSVYPKPARWRRNISFNYGTGAGNNTMNTILEAKYEFLRAYWPNPTQTGFPRFYADYDYQHILVAPTPDQAYPFEYSYIELPSPLSVSNQTNWITNYAPQILLYASLLESAPYLQTDERIETWNKFYREGMDELKKQNARRVVGDKNG
jgi:hypothetical protein